MHKSQNEKIAFSEKLNQLIVETFRDILELEEKMLHSFGKMNLSISEIHVIEAIALGKGDGRTISELADDLRITLPSVTNAVKKLEANGYVQKIKSEYDGRSVNVVLTPLGQKIDSAHRYFHKLMVLEVADELTDEDMRLLVRAIEKLDNFFKRKTEQNKYEF